MNEAAAAAVSDGDMASTASASNGNNLSGDWWDSLSVLEDDTFGSPIPLDASEGGLWAGNFVPPPPRPAFLDEAATPDGVTTCDLCSWAWKDASGLFSLDGTLEAHGELGWLLTLIIVSLISAVIGAVIMVTVLHWRRFKSSGSRRGVCSLCLCISSATNRSSNPENGGDNTQTLRMRERAPVPTPDTDKEPTNDSSTRHIPNDTNVNPNAMISSGVWSWLTSRKSPISPIQLITPTNATPVENHYTHMDEAYAAVGEEALYAELDRESNCSPAYQNTAYNGSDTEPDAPISSAPSSAYYSDLSVTMMPERAYEIVGGVSSSSTWSDATAPGDKLERRLHSNLISGGNGSAPTIRLAAINENVTVQPSDYV